MRLPEILEQTLQDIYQQPINEVTNPALALSIQQLSYPVLYEVQLLAACYQRAKASAEEHPLYLSMVAERLRAALGLSTPEPCHIAVVPAPPAPPGQTLMDYLPWFVQLTNLTQARLGKALVRNYWLLARPQDPWLRTISVERFCQPVPTVQQGNPALNNQQQSLLQCWLDQFIAYCSRILPTLPSEAVAAGLPLPHQLPSCLPQCP